MIYTDIGKKIKEERIKKGLTQEELGELIESTGAYIGQIERGERSASMVKIISIATKLNISIDYLTGNICFEPSKELDNNIIEELKNATNTQKQMVTEIIKIIKRYT